MKFESIVSLLVFYLSINLGFSSDVIENWSCIAPKATLANFSITISKEDEELYPSIEEIVKIQKNCEAKKIFFRHIVKKGDSSKISPIRNQPRLQNLLLILYLVKLDTELIMLN